MRAVQKSGKPTKLNDGGGRGDGRLVMMIRPHKDAPITEWYAAHYRDGRQRLVKMANYPALGVSDARRTFRTGYLPIITTGGNPEGHRSRKPKSSGDTIHDLFSAYADHIEKAASKNYARQGRYALLGVDGDGGLAKDIGPTKRAADVVPQDIIPHLEIGRAHV